MVISFYGAAKTVTGSKHLLTLENGKRILLDCGLFQGGDKAYELNRDFGFDPEAIDYLILSHAHTDHTGLIPRLVKMGFSGKIYCTPATLELCQLLLIDGANIQNYEARKRGGKTEDALYSLKDAEESLERFITVPYNKPYQIDEEVELLFTDAGHILGSAAINLRIQEEGQITSLCYTGDIGRYENRILRPPQEFPQADIILCESTYGSKFHSTVEKSEERLLEIVQQTCVEKKGKLLIPAFSIGRTQELVYSLNILAEDGRLPEGVNVFVDSPLSVYATDIMRSHPENFNQEMLDFIQTDPDPFGFPELHFITDQEDSKILNALNAPCVIISSSGMMEGGRILHHLKKNISDARNTVLVTGYCEPSTVCGQLLEKAETIRVFGEEQQVNAEIIQMNEYSAHGDFSDLVRFLHCQDKDLIQKLYLVHGNESVMKKFKADLEEMGYQNIEIPNFRMSYDVAFNSNKL